MSDPDFDKAVESTRELLSEAHEKHGGQAFPYTFDMESNNKRREHFIGVGMTLRDYFAAKVLATVVREHIECARLAGAHEIDRDDAAASAYFMADAMLKARAR